MITPGAVVGLLALAATVALGAVVPGRPGPRRPGPPGAPGPARLGWHRVRPGEPAGHTATVRGTVEDHGARWAGPRDVRALRCRPPEPGRLVLGELLGRRGRRAHLRRGTVLATEPAQSLAVVGPTQSGKSSALAIPAILGWEGPVLAASVKADLLRDTLAERERRGTVWCFDPSGTTGKPAHRWSPLAAARSWSGARRVAADLTEVSRGEGTTADGDFWYATAAKLLAPLLFAAARGGRSMADVVRWVDTQEMAEVAELLESAGEPAAVDAARATWQRDERQRSSVYTTAETVLEPFADPRVADAAVAPSIDPRALLAGRHTLYLCAPAHDQRRLRALFCALVKAVLEEAFTGAAMRGSPLDPPLLVVLDEAAHIAPLAELDGLAATAAGHGIQLITVWQDLAQINARYGARASTVVNNHRAKLFLTGIADPGTLDHASHLVGDEEVFLPPPGRAAEPGSAVPRQRRLLPPDALRRQRPGTGVLLYGSLPPVRVGLVPWWQQPHLVAGRPPARPHPGPLGDPGRRRAPWSR